MMRLYASIEKVAKRDDGTVDVVGFASSETVDSDGEIITADAMRSALPDYMKFANVREMHDATKAAGTATDAVVQSDGKTYFAVHVVDPIAVLKVESGVYKGFSIAGRVLERSGNKITQLKLVEVSLVDRPANPDAIFTCYKCETDEKLLPTNAVESTLAKTETIPTQVLDDSQADPAIEKSKALLMRLAKVETALFEAQKILSTIAQRLEKLETTPELSKPILKVVNKEADSPTHLPEIIATNPKDAILKAHRQGGFRIA